ncbi:MAG: T9SS type A sorting domain-containing protein [Bacteroidia bacterium]
MKKIILIFVCITLMFNVKAQLLQSYTQESWLNEDWQYTFRYLYFYDDVENLVQTDFNQYDVSNSSWYDSFRDTVYFDANGRIDSLISSLYNTTSMQWDAFSISTYEYSPEGYVLSFLVENYVDGVKVPSSFNVSEYDENGFLTQIIYNLWDAQSESWLANFKTSQVPDNQENAVTSASYLYSTDTQDWVDYQRIANTYSSSGKVITSFREAFVSGAWVNSSQSTFEYDASNNLILESRDAWVNSTESWINNFKIEYTNTSFGKVAQMLSTYWDSNSSIWLNSQRGNYVYSEPSGLRTTQIEEAILFPNPTDGFFKILKAEGAQLTILNSTGTVVNRVWVYDGESIDTENYAPGLYTVLVNNGPDLRISRFIKK